MNLKFLLTPFEHIYFFITSVRNFLYDKGIFKVWKFDDLNIISVGNVSVGGSGKTPLVELIARRLILQGKNVAIVSRGYKSKIKKGVYEVLESDSPRLVGDEPYMLYRNLNFSNLSASNLSVNNNLKCKVVVSPKRVKGVRYLRDNYKNIDTIILDDAMQHRAIYRNTNILCVDVGSKKARRDFLLNELLPKGFLRESIYQALRRTTLVVLNHRAPVVESDFDVREGAIREDNVKEDIKKIKNLIPKNLRVFESFVYKLSIYDSNFKNVDIEKNIVVFCAISKPVNFFYSLEYFGFKIIKNYVFLDHREIKEEKLEQIYNEAKEKNAFVVCTEKDFVKLNRKWQERIFFAKISIAFRDSNKVNGDEVNDSEVNDSEVNSDDIENDFLNCL